MSIAVDTLVEAQQRAMAVRQSVGGFPVLAKVLHQAGARMNEWVLPACQSTYLTDHGPVVQQGQPLERGSLEVPVFDQDALVAAIRADQAGRSLFPDFLRAAWNAGVVRYVVDFDERTVTYYGTGEGRYVEAYPDADLPSRTSGSVQPAN